MWAKTAGSLTDLGHQCSSFLNSWGLLSALSDGKIQMGTSRPLRLGETRPMTTFTAGEVLPGLGSTLPKWAVLASFLHCYHLAAGPNAHYLSRNRTRCDSRDPVYKPAAGGRKQE